MAVVCSKNDSFCDRIHEKIKEKHKRPYDEGIESAKGDSVDGDTVKTWTNFTHFDIQAGFVSQIAPQYPG